MKRKIMATFLSAVMCMSIIPMTALANVTEFYDLWVNGEQFTSDNLTIECGGGTAEFDPDLWELTLTDATITNPYICNGAALGIYSTMTQGIDINVVGTNNIDLSGASIDKETDVCGIYYDYNDDEMVLKGSGTLNIDVGTDRENETFSIYSNCALEIGGITLDCKAADYGICAQVYLYVNAKKLKVATRIQDELLYSNEVDCENDSYEIMVADNPDGTDAETWDGESSFNDYQYLSMELVKYPVWVNGEQFTRDITEIKCGDGTATYAADKNELTLKDAEITKTCDIADYNDGIHAEADLNIILEGSNSITLDDADDGIGLKGSGDLTLSGTGSLDITANTKGEKYGYGIYENEGATSINMDGKLTINSVCSCIYAEEEMNIESNGDIILVSSKSIALEAKTTLKIDGSGDISVTTTGEGYDAICSNGTVDIGGSGKLTVEKLIDDGEDGIAGYNGVTIHGSRVLDITAPFGIFSENGSIDITENCQVNITNKSFGLDVGNADITISTSGDVNIKGNGGIYIADGDLILSGSGKVDIETTYAECISIENPHDNEILLNGKTRELRLVTIAEQEVIDNYDIIDNAVGGTSLSMYTVSDSADEDENVLVYSWKTYNATFDMGGHGTAPEDQTVYLDEVIEKPSDPTADGYKFEGWYSDRACTKAFDFDVAYNVDTTIFAKWTCAHKNTEIRDAKDASLTEKGYTGDTYCKDCGELIKKGEEIPMITPEPTPSGEPTPTSKPNGEPTPTVPPTTPTPAPELNVGDFVDRCYEVALGREADEDGYNYWKDQLTNGEACGAQVGFGFIFSSEYINKNTTNEQFVTDMYSMFFGREADEAGYNYWLEQLNAGTATREQVFAGFANSEEFYNLCNKFGVVSGYYAVGVPNDQQGGVNCFVARLYKVCLNRLPDMGGQAGWVMKLLNGEVSGSSCAYGFVFSPEFINMNLDNVNFVNYMYKAFFGREADEEGLNYWVEQLNAGTATREDIFAGFSGSAEFANLCASYGINA